MRWDPGGFLTYARVARLFRATEAGERRMSDQQLAARVRAALDAGEGHPAAGPDLGPAVVPDAGRPAQARPAGPLRPGHPPRRDRRALVRLDHPRRQRGRARRRGAELRRPRRRPVHPQGRHRPARPRDDRRRRSGTRTSAGRSTASSSTTSARSPTTCTRTQEQAAKLGREGKPESYYFPPQLNWTGNNFPYTFMGLEPGTTKDDIRRCLERWDEGDNGILDLLQGLPPQARHRLADPPVRPARPRLAGDLRAAVGLRRLRHVPVDGRRPPRPLGACSSRTSPRTSTTTSTTSSTSSTGRRTSIPSSRTTTTWSRSSTRRLRGRGLRRPVDRLRHASTASSSSAPAS